MNLIGKVTPGGWSITSSVTFSADHTGGHFSDCYHVEKEGRKAFLKALDIEKFDIGEIPSLLQGFDYESSLVTFCRDKNLRRVVRVIELDRVERDPTAVPVLRHVPFLVFELADGDIRETVDVSKNVSDQWRFRVLHQTCLALMELHKQQIAHQDLKPSNVLRFGADLIKIGDLGRSSLRGKPSPYDAFDIPGALNYAPFELRYGHTAGDWIERRLSTDVFHFGCLVVFAFTNICFPEFVLQRLAPSFRPEAWGDTYPQVIAQIRAAFSDALLDISNDFPARFRADLTGMVQDLCDPDPVTRGRKGKSPLAPANSLWLERYVSRLAILEKASGLKLERSSA